MTENPTPEPSTDVDVDRNEPAAERAPMKVETGELNPGYTPEPDPNHREPILDPGTGLTDIQVEEAQAAENLGDDAGVDENGN